MNAFKVRLLIVAISCFFIGGCADIMQKGFGVNRCDRDSDVRSTGWVKGTQGCYDAVCEKVSNENGSTWDRWRRTGPFESCS